MLRMLLSPVLTVVAVVAMLLATFLFGSYVIVLGWIRPHSRQVDTVVRLWGRFFLLVTNTRVTARGLDRLDPTASYVFCGNHISAIDIPVMIGTLPVSVRFLAKKELFGFPILGRAMRTADMIETDRRAGPAAHRTINAQVTRAVGRGLSLMIYPEGTRSKDGEIMPFKKGAFRIAIDNGMPLVPITITGSERVWRPGSKLIRGGRVQLVIHDPIPTAALAATDIADLRDRVRAIVATTYEEIRVR